MHGSDRHLRPNDAGLSPRCLSPGSSGNIRPRAPRTLVSALVRRAAGQRTWSSLRPTLMKRRSLATYLRFPRRRLWWVPRSAAWRADAPLAGRRWRSTVFLPGDGTGQRATGRIIVWSGRGSSDEPSPRTRPSGASVDDQIGVNLLRRDEPHRLLPPGP
jgi:hypothetical protein